MRGWLQSVCHHLHSPNSLQGRSARLPPTVQKGGRGLRKATVYHSAQAWVAGLKDSPTATSAQPGRRRWWTLGNFCLRTGSSCSGTSRGPLKRPVLDSLSCHFGEDEGRAGEERLEGCWRTWKPAVCPLLKEGKQMGLGNHSCQPMAEKDNTARGHCTAAKRS